MAFVQYKRGVWSDIIGLFPVLHHNKMQFHNKTIVLVLNREKQLQYIELLSRYKVFPTRRNKKYFLTAIII
ncbi:hypothetical protein DHD32_05315 [Arenibacter sp. TNZ]|nr:hypothetical protein [Arenibacter sp. TNZ]